MNVVTKDGISWTAPRRARFIPMKFKVLIEKKRYTSDLSSTSSLKWHKLDSTTPRPL
jgi:hypothetical protein